MGASSVTGVSGVGSADKLGQKGPSNGRNQFVPLVSPHVVLAGFAVLDEGGTTVTLPTPLAGGNDAYVVMLTNTTNNVAYISNLSDDEDGTFVSFDIGGSDVETVHYMVCTAGHGA